jgi:hypothetical protein
MTSRDSAMPLEPVFMKRIKYGASVLIAALRSPRQKSMVMSIATPITTLRIKDHHIARGTLMDESSTSSVGIVN